MARRSAQGGRRGLAAAGLVGAILAARAAAAQAPTILFVTQPPYAADFATVNATFGNHRGGTEAAPRGGDLWIRYGDGTLRNLTAEAGFGLVAGQEIAVREPCVHWSGRKALFSMVVGGTARDGRNAVHWQIYEVSGLGRDEPVSIVGLPQPTEHENVSPIYGTDDRILFTSNLPHNGDQRSFPQLDEYESQPTVSGLWSMRPDGSDLRLLDHSPSGDFTPIVASDGRVVFTRWDHLQRDQQSDDGALETYGAFDFFSETSTLALRDTLEIFPEPRRRAPGSPEHGHTMNQFLPWQVNEDGTGLETLNHVGRHELASYFDAARDHLDEFIAPEERRTAERLFHVEEDPLHPGRFYATYAPEFATHAAGQIVSLRGGLQVNADDMQVRYVTDRVSAAPIDDGDPVPEGHPGLLRNPTPLSDGTLIAVRTSSPRADRPTGGRLSSRYDFHLERLAPGRPYWTPAGRLLDQPIIESISYWDDSSYQQLSYSGPLWELDPVEVRERPRPARHADPTPRIELDLLEEELGGAAGVERLRSYLRRRNLALLVSRNVTRRADREQEYNLEVEGGTARTAEPGATPEKIAWLQVLEGRLIRGYSRFQEGRRAIAQLLGYDANPRSEGAPPSSVALGADGSFAVLVPARRALTWQLLGPDGTPVVRERYWVTLQPGEVRVCGNCHGINRSDVVLHEPPPTNVPQALRTLARWWRDVARDGTTPLLAEARPAEDFGSLTLLGESFQPGAAVLLGDSTTPWADVVVRSARRIRLSGGAQLAARFPAGSATRVRVVNPGGAGAQVWITRRAS